MIKVFTQKLDYSNPGPSVNGAILGVSLLLYELIKNYMPYTCSIVMT